MPCALVTEVAERGALEACRGLDAAGYSVVGVSRAKLAPGRWSRAVGRRVRLPSPPDDEAGFVDGLARTVNETKTDVLVPGGEVSLLAVSARRERFDGVAHGLPSEEIVDRALDKLRLLELADAAGLALPESRVCATVDEARAAAQAIGFPVVVKPPRSVVRTPEGMRQQKIAVAADETVLEEAVAAAATPFVVQQFLTDPVKLSCAGVRASEELRAVTVARHVRMWPPGAGSASFAETIEPPAELVSRVEALLESVGWEGIFEVEVLSLPDGRLAAMDLNPRVFGWMTLARQAGVNIAAIWCDALRGELRPRVTARPGVAYRWEDAELFHLFRSLRRGRFDEARSVLRPRRGTAYGYGRLNDPAPLAARMIDVIARNVAR